jgi:hypothetical protein
MPDSDKKCTIVFQCESLVEVSERLQCASRPNSLQAVHQCKRETL